MSRRLDIILLIIGIPLLCIAHYWGLAIAPTEREMGESYRIIYAHVPSAQALFLGYILTFIGSVMYLMKGSYKFDILAEAGAEVGLVFNALCLITGSLWGKPTWGTYWQWDPRLTFVAILFVGFAGYLALRRVVTEPEKRARWSAAVAIVLAAALPLTYYSVKMWNSIHQVQSTVNTVSDSMILPLRLSLAAWLCLFILFISVRFKIGRHALEDQLRGPPEPVVRN